MTENKDIKIGGLLLAAGGSSRFGEPKQLLQFHSQTLIRRATETLVASSCNPVVVVLGAEINRSTRELAGLPIYTVINEDWKTGMGSSITTGLKELLKINSNLAAVIIILCDQPHVTSDKIDLFTNEFRKSGATIIAAEYGGTVGVPALFSSTLFDELFRLRGDKGARDLIRRRSDDVMRIKLEAAAFDLDTIEDVTRMISQKP